MDKVARTLECMTECNVELHEWESQWNLCVAQNLEGDDTWVVVTAPVDPGVLEEMLDSSDTWGIGLWWCYEHVDGATGHITHGYFERVRVEIIDRWQTVMQA